MVVIVKKGMLMIGFDKGEVSSTEEAGRRSQVFMDTVTLIYKVILTCAMHGADVDRDTVVLGLMTGVKMPVEVANAVVTALVDMGRIVELEGLLLPTDMTASDVIGERVGQVRAAILPGICNN